MDKNPSPQAEFVGLRHSYMQGLQPFQIEIEQFCRGAHKPQSTLGFGAQHGLFRQRINRSQGLSASKTAWRITNLSPSSDHNRAWESSQRLRKPGTAA